MLAVARVATRAGKPFPLGARILLMRGRRRPRGTAHNPAPDQRLGRLPIPNRRCRSLADA